MHALCIYAYTCNRFCTLQICITCLQSFLKRSLSFVPVKVSWLIWVGKEEACIQLQWQETETHTHTHADKNTDKQWHRYTVFDKGLFIFYAVSWLVSWRKEERTGRRSPIVCMLLVLSYFWLIFVHSDESLSESVHPSHKPFWVSTVLSKSLNSPSCFKFLFFYSDFISFLVSDSFFLFNFLSFSIQHTENKYGCKNHYINHCKMRWWFQMFVCHCILPTFQDSFNAWSLSMQIIFWHYFYHNQINFY